MQEREDDLCKKTSYEFLLNRVASNYFEIQFSMASPRRHIQFWLNKSTATIIPTYCCEA